MYIKKLTASFGKLKNSSLELKNGLNIIEAPNENGKSTWCAFIRTMLFGLNTSERDRADRLADKTRFRPWDGGTMEGVMEINWKGNDVTVSRTASGSVPMKKFDAHYSDILRPVEELSAADFGETVTGMTAGVFARTSFIGQSSLAVSGDADLEKRITSLVSAGDENVSYSAADEKLRTKQRKLRYNRRGTINDLQAEYESLKNQYAAIDRLSERLSELEQDEAKYEDRIAALDNDCKAYAILERKERQNKLNAARRNAAEAKFELAKNTKKLTKNGRLVSQDDISDIGALYSTYKSLRAASDSASSSRTDERTVSDLKEAKEAFSFGGRPCEEIKNARKTAKELKSECDSMAKKLPSALFYVLIAVSVLAAALSVFFAVKSKLIPAGLLLLCALLIALYVISVRRRQAQAKDRLKAHVSAYTGGGYDYLIKNTEPYCRAYEEYEKAVSDYSESEKAYSAALLAFENAKNALMERVRIIFPDAASPDEIYDLITPAAHDLRDRALLEKNLAIADADYTHLVELYGSDSSDDSEVYVKVPERSRVDTEDALRRARQNLHDTQNEKASVTGQISALADPLTLKVRMETLISQIGECEKEYAALDMAVSVLKESSLELETKFSPLINDAAAKIMEKLTDGKYKKLVFDKAFNAQAKTEGDIVSRSAAYLSAGTADQIYLSLRLAIVDLTSGDETCPIILDDALANFDDSRASLALDYLLELSKSRQIILFTCHSREASHFSSAANVNVIRL